MVGIRSIMDNFNVLWTRLGSLRKHPNGGEKMTDGNYKKLHGKFCIPIWRPFKVSSPYGLRTLNKITKIHDGIDFVSRTGCNDVFAVYDGIVIYDQDNYDHDKRWLKGHTGGNMVILQHRIDGEIYYSRYLHLGSNNVSIGDVVHQGTCIGEYGDFGKSYGAHLHFDLSVEKWVKIDPTLFFKNL